MNTLFGIPMGAIAAVLFGIVCVSILALAFAALRSPVLFRMGLRNIPRRRAQTIIIVCGLMVSTLIVTAAFTVGDSLSYSITKAVYDKAGPVDVKVEPRPVGGAATAGAPYISADTVSAIESQVGDSGKGQTWLQIINEPVPATNPGSRLTEPRVHLIGLKPDAVQSLGGLPAANGGTVQVSDLGPNEAYVNQTAADKLLAKAGDTVAVVYGNQSHSLTVKAVVKDRTLTGYQEPQRDDNGGVVTSLDTAQAITGHAGGVNGLWLSTSTDVRAGNALGNAIFPTVKDAVASPTVASTLDGTSVALKAHNSKHDGVNGAETFGNIFTSFFLLIGLFSISAGMMLIFLIFVMLAAERRAEMGMARAVGIKRSGLMQSFLAEGMVYNLLAGVVGVLAGIGVAFGLVWFITHVVFTGKYELPLAGHVSLRSVIVSYCLGVALTFITVVISAWKATRMNIVAAIRDLPEDNAQGEKRRRNMKLLGSSFARLAGSVAVLVALSAGSKLGLVAIPVFLVGLALLVVACLPVTRKLWSIAWRVLASLPAGIIWGILGASRAMGWSWSAIWSGYCIVLGALAVLASNASSSLFLFTLGASLLLLGLALAARVRGVSSRLAFTVLSVLMLAFWLMPGSTFRSLFGNIYGKDPGNIEMFFLSGIMLVVATTLLLLFNAELLALAVNRVGGRLGSLRPSLATAIAYPMASRLRTGMTLAMFSLIIFSITVMSTLNSNFNHMLLTSDATGGWDVTATTNLNNPVPDLKAALQQTGVDTSNFTAVGATSPYTTLTDVRNPGDANWARYNVRAADTAFLDAAQLKLQAHEKGMAASDAWKTLEREPGTAIVDSLALSGQPGSGEDQPNFTIKGVRANATLLDKPLVVEVRNAAGQVSQLKVIGIINQVVGNVGFTLFTSGQTYQQALGARPDFSLYSIRLAKGANDTTVANEIKANLGQQGVQASAVRSDLKDAQAQSQGFSYLLQGFMGLGLVVGIAAVAVIAARTVVERRQQIGMLRAVGYKKGQVALSFALETSFIALFGIGAGVVTAVILSYNLFTGNTFGDTSSAGFQLPYLQIALFAGISYVASLAMTYFPSRKAASLPIAEALRYE